MANLSLMWRGIEEYDNLTFQTESSVYDQEIGRHFPCGSLVYISLPGGLKNQLQHL